MPDESIWSFAVVAFLVVSTGPAMISAHDNAATPLTVHDEALTVDYNESVSVSDPSPEGRYSETVELENASGAPLVAGEDYRWDAGSGEVAFHDTAATSSGETARVTYDRMDYTQATSDVWTLLSGLYSILGLFVFVQALRALMAYVGERNPLTETGRFS